MANTMEGLPLLHMAQKCRLSDILETLEAPWFGRTEADEFIIYVNGKWATSEKANPFMPALISVIQKMMREAANGKANVVDQQQRTIISTCEVLKKVYKTDLQGLVAQIMTQIKKASGGGVRSRTREVPDWYPEFDVSEDPEDRRQYRELKYKERAQSLSQHEACVVLDAFLTRYLDNLQTLKHFEQTITAYMDTIAPSLLLPSAMREYFAARKRELGGEPEDGGSSSESSEDGTASPSSLWSDEREASLAEMTGAGQNGAVRVWKRKQDAADYESLPLDTTALVRECPLPLETELQTAIGASGEAFCLGAEPYGYLAIQEDSAMLAGEKRDEERGVENSKAEGGDEEGEVKEEDMEVVSHLGQAEAERVSRGEQSEEEESEGEDDEEEEDGEEDESDEDGDDESSDDGGNDDGAGGTSDADRSNGADGDEQGPEDGGGSDTSDSCSPDFDMQGEANLDGQWALGRSPVRPRSSAHVRGAPAASDADVVEAAFSRLTIAGVANASRPLTVAAEVVGPPSSPVVAADVSDTPPDNLQHGQAPTVQERASLEGSPGVDDVSRGEDTVRDASTPGFRFQLADASANDAQVTPPAAEDVCEMQSPQAAAADVPTVTPQRSQAPVVQDASLTGDVLPADNMRAVNDPVADTRISQPHADFFEGRQVASNNADLPEERGQKAAPEIEALSEAEGVMPALHGGTDTQANDNEPRHIVNDRVDGTTGSVGGPADGEDQQSATRKQLRGVESNPDELADLLRDRLQLRLAAPTTRDVPKSESPLGSLVGRRSDITSPPAAGEPALRRPKLGIDVTEDVSREHTNDMSLASTVVNLSPPGPDRSGASERTLSNLDEESSSSQGGGSYDGTIGRVGPSCQGPVAVTPPAASLHGLAMANAHVDGEWAGACISVALPLQALQSCVQLYNEVCVAQKAMTFREKSGEQLKNRVRFVSYQLLEKYQVLQADIQAGRLTALDADAFAYAVRVFHLRLSEALNIIARCKGNMLYRCAKAKSIEEDFRGITSRIFALINDMHLPSTSSRTFWTTKSSGSGVLILTRFGEKAPSLIGTSDDGTSGAHGPSAGEIDHHNGYITQQLQLLGLFTNREILAFTEYVQAVTRGHGVTYLHNKMATDLPFETIRGPGPVFCSATSPPRPPWDSVHRSPVTALAVRVDSGDVFSGHRDGVVCIWRNSICAAGFGVQSTVPVTALLVMPDGTLVVGNGRGELRARSTDPPYAEMPSTDHVQPGAITALAASGEGVLFSGDSTGGVLVWGPGFSAPRPYFKAHVKAVTALCVSPRNESDHFFVFSGGADGQIRAWAFPECAPPLWEARFNVQTGGAPVRALTLSADRSALYSVRGKGHVTRWAVPGAENKCALAISRLGGGPLVVTERGLLLGAANRRRNVAAWHMGELSPGNVQFLKRSSDPKRPIPCGGAGFLLGDDVYGLNVFLGPLDEITTMKVVEIGAPGSQALLVTGLKGGGVRISKVVSW